MLNAKSVLAGIGASALAFSAAPALANDVALVACEESLGIVALIDGSAAGWTQWNLGSPRALINALAVQSGCFTPHAGGSEPARFLITAVAGSQEDVDQSVELARGAATEALIRSGAAGSVLRSVPFGGAALGMLGGLGGKRKTVAAGLQVVSPSNGQTIASGTGSVTRSSLSFRGNNNAWAQQAASASGYQSSGDGRMLTEAFVIAFNELVAQRTALAAAPDPAPASGTGAAAAAVAAVQTAVDAVMRKAPHAGSEQVRSLRAGTSLNPTGQREGLFVEVTDSFGTTGWVSVEDMQ